MTVRPAMCWSNSSKPSAELDDALAKACHQHLKSEAVRGKVMESIESELLKILQDWAKKGDSVGKLGMGKTRPYLWEIPTSIYELFWGSPG